MSKKEKEKQTVYKKVLTESIKSKPFILVDGSSYLFRAFYALPDLTSENGQHTGAIYGVINMLRKLISTYEPTHMVVVFDSKGKNFRHDLFNDYKANRAAMPDELAEQIMPLHNIINAMGIPLLTIPGVEADDVIGTLAVQAEAFGFHIIISTGDKDLAQLVTDKIVLINTMNDTVLDIAGVEGKFSLPPNKIIDYLALMGDPVDNIPGIPKVGPKTAVKWLQQYESLDGIIANAEQIKGKVGDSLRMHLSSLPLYKTLTTIKTDVKLEVNPEQLTIQKQEQAKLQELFLELDFNRFVKGTETTISTPKTYDIILTKYDFNQWLEQLQQAKVIAIDTETTSLNYISAEIVGISFAIEANKAAYVPIAHTYPDAPQQLELNYVLTQLQPILSNKNIVKIGHNIKYDLHVLANYGIEVKGQLYDTMLESYVLDSVGSRHDLDTLARKHLAYETITYEQVAGKGAKQIPFNQIHLEQAAPYAAEDADVTLQLHQILFSKLQKITNLYQVFLDLEMPLVQVLLTIERKGVLIDLKLLNQQSHELAKRLDELEQQAYNFAGEEFNINSPKQLQEILFNKLSLPIIAKTPTGQASTAEDVLQELAINYPLPKLILEYRSLSKLKSTYTDSLPLQVNKKTHRVHTSYNQAVTTTGRLSSTEPNLQNIPIRTEEGKKIRKAFIAESGNKILAVDYSQIELRIMAHLSSEPVLLSAFEKNIDIHSVTAAEIFGVDISAVTSEQRRKAKAINFGLLYGMSGFGLAKQLGIYKKDADQYVEFYFAKFPKVKLFLEKVKADAATNGYVETLFGRRLYLPDIRSKNVMQRKAAERVATNAPMQGGQADIIKRAMIAIHDWQLSSNLEFWMLLQVHDELVFEVPEVNLDIVCDNVVRLMRDAAKLSVELAVSVDVGDSWGG